MKRTGISAPTSWHERRATVDTLRKIQARGFTVVLVAQAEDAQTPGFPGQIRGVVDWENKVVKLGMLAHFSLGDLAETLDHELRHIQEPTWDCGNRDVVGRGGPTT